MMKLLIHAELTSMLSTEKLTTLKTLLSKTKDFMISIIQSLFPELKKKLTKKEN